MAFGTQDIQKFWACVKNCSDIDSKCIIFAKALTLFAPLKADKKHGGQPQMNQGTPAEAWHHNVLNQPGSSNA